MKTYLALFIAISLIASCKDTQKEKGLIPVSTNDTSAIFNWTTDACEIMGTYNPKNYTKEQLKNTYDLWFTFSTVPLETNAIVFEPSQIAKLSIEKLTEEYIQKKEHYNRSEIISYPFWINLKNKRINELENDYDLKKITISAFSNPSVLIGNRFTKYCPEYARVLASGDSSELLSVWKLFAEREKGHNEVYMKKFNEEFNSSDRLIYAKVQLLTFGWWNCVNGNLPHTDRDSIMEMEFNKLFKQIKSKCDDVD